MVLPVPSDHDLSTITRERDHQWHAYSRQQSADQDAADEAPRRTPCNADRAACGTRGTHPRAAIEPRANKRVADGSRRSTGGDYIGALDSACLEGDSADTAGGAKPARDAGTPPPLLRERSVGLAALWRNRFAACGIRMMRRPAAARSDGRCANASMHHYAPLVAPPPGPILPLRPTAWTECA